MHKKHSFSRIPELIMGLLIIALSVLAPPKAWSQHLWSNYYNPNAGEAHCKTVATDSQGNVYMTGDFSGVVDFGGGPAGEDSKRFIFLVKLDPDGGYVWSKCFGSTSGFFKIASGITVDHADNVILTGEFSEDVDFGGGTLTTTGISDWDVFIAKFSPDGVHVWSEGYGATGNEQGLAVATDEYNNIFVTGWHFGGLDFGGGTLPDSGSADVFVVKFDSDGSHMWSKSYGAEDADRGKGIAIDGNGDAYVTGNKGNQIFVTKYDGDDGTILWGNILTGTDGENQGRSIAADGNGNVFVTGKFKGTVDFDPLSNNPDAVLTSPVAYDIFVVKYGAEDGEFHWIRRFNNVRDFGWTGGYAVVVDPQGNAIITAGFGSRQSSVNPGGGKFWAWPVESDFFMAKYDPNGSHLWSQRYGGEVEGYLSGWDEAYGLAIDCDERIIMAGAFESPLNLGGDDFDVEIYPDNAFVAKFTQPDNEISGHIATETAWGDYNSGTTATMIVTGDLVIDEADTLFINTGTTVLVAPEDSNHDSEDGIDPDRVEIIVKGALVFAGDGTEPIVFKSNDPAPGTCDWIGIRYLSSAGTANLSGVIIENAYMGVRSEVAVTVDGCEISDASVGVWSSAGATITHTTFSGVDLALQLRAGDAILRGISIENCGRGIEYCQLPKGETATLTCDSTSLTGLEGSPGVLLGGAGTGHIYFDFDNVTVSDASGAGIMINTNASGSIDGCKICGNSFGIALNNCRDVMISDCIIVDNSDYGISALDGGGHAVSGDSIAGSHYGLYFLGTQNVKVDTNCITGNDVGVWVLGEASPDLGNGSTGSTGHNSIANNTLQQICNFNDTATVMAENNWWGSGLGPRPGKIIGLVDYSPWLEEDPQVPTGISGQPMEPGRDENFPAVHNLSNVYPNPFNPITTIVFEIAEPGAFVDIQVFDTGGRRVRTLVGESFSPGSYTLSWDGTNDDGQPAASGVYFVRMKADHYQTTKKLVLLK